VADRQQFDRRVRADVTGAAGDKRCRAHEFPSPLGRVRSCGVFCMVP
jgi:hypothetical protein